MLKPVQMASITCKILVCPIMFRSSTPEQVIENEIDILVKILSTFRNNCFPSFGQAKNAFQNFRWVMLQLYHHSLKLRLVDVWIDCLTLFQKFILNRSFISPKYTEQELRLVGRGFAQFCAGTRLSLKALMRRIVVTDPLFITRNNSFEKGCIAVPETVSPCQLHPFLHCFSVRSCGSYSLNLLPESRML